LSQIGTAFLPSLSVAFDNISRLIDNVTPKLTELAGNVVKGFETFSKSKQANQYMQIFQTIGSTTFNAIKAVIEAVSPTVKSIFDFIGRHSGEISSIVKVLGSIWKSVWKTVGTLLEGAWGICSPLLGALLKAIEKVSGAVETVCNWWNKMVELLKKPINAAVNVSKNLFGGENSEGRNAFGSGRITRDGTVRTLHEGEKVLTKRETDAYLSGQNNQGVNIFISNLAVREEADVTKVANELVRKIKQNKIVYAGAY